MADASIIDIGGTQWNVKDKKARDKITVIEDMINVKDLPDLIINKTPDYSWSTFQLYNHYSFGKIHFIYIRLQNVKGSNIGSFNSARLGFINIKPIKETSFMMYDYLKGKAIRCYLDVDGYFTIGESKGISSGTNDCFGELIFAEA